MTGLLLAGGVVVDGTGAPPVTADVLVEGGTVAAIGHQLDAPYAERRDARGLVVCPGFVDIHTHSDLTLLSNPLAHSKVHQGVTTEVVGNCGLGVAPLTDTTDRVALRGAVSYLDLDPDVELDWRDTAGHLDALARAGPSIHVATLTGHLALRAATVGFGDRPAEPDELGRMRELLRESFAQGSLGVSTGLVYAPMCFATDDELVALGDEVAAAGRVFTWHVRDYADGLLDSVAQALRVGERTGCRTQISHLTAVGRRNWGAVNRALDMVEASRRAGVDVHVDAYPYLHGNAPLVQLLPAWAQEGEPSELPARLRSPEVRAAIRTEWLDRPTTWDDVTISWVPADAAGGWPLGTSIAEIGRQRDEHPDEVALDVLAELGSAVLMIAGGRSEDDMRTVLAHPAAVVASDGLSLDPDGPTGAGSPHPRSYGCFPRYLAHVADPSPDDLAAAVQRCTGAPARAIGLDDRGVLRVGGPADVVAFDPAVLTDRATFAEPQLFAAGIELVAVAGEVVVDAGHHTGRRPGEALRAG